MIASVRTAVVVLALSFVTACSSLVIEPGQMPMGVDHTVGRAIESPDRHMVLVTISDDLHGKLSQGESIKQDGRLPPLYARFMAQMEQRHGLSRVADWPLETIAIRCLVFESSRPVTAKLLDELRADQLIDSAQAMNYFTVSAESQRPGYDDPYFELQEGHGVMRVPATHGWSTGRGVLVAVIDTGFDSGHVDLKDRVYGIRNFVDRSYSNFRKDVHGTAVAGIIAATANNGAGIVGVAPDSRLLGLKACAVPASGRGSARCNSFTLAKAINFAIVEQADVINLSLAGPADALLERLIRRAMDRGIVVVGSKGLLPDQQFPAAIDGVVGAASKRTDDTTIVAPGQQIVTTVPGDEYDFFSGNSFAAAQVTGIVALIRQRKPHLSAEVVYELLKGASDQDTGYANACRALERIVGVSNSAGNYCGASEPITNLADSR